LFYEPVSETIDIDIYVQSTIMTAFAIITFPNSHFAIRAKKILERSGQKSETIPVPREFSSECGFCCKVIWENKQEIEDILRENNVELDRVYYWERDEDRVRNKKFRFV
jgi:hypothetical protein